MAFEALYRVSSFSINRATRNHNDIELGESLSGNTNHLDLGERKTTVPDEFGSSFAGAVLQSEMRSKESTSLPDDFGDSFAGAVQQSEMRSRKSMMLRQRSSMGIMLKEEIEEEQRHRFAFLSVTKLQFYGFIVPMFISLWYSAAILFPPEARKGKLSFILWTEGSLVNNVDGKPSICPRVSICSEGIFQLILIALARLSAFASYVTMGITFATKMHSTIHFFSSTFLSTWIPFEGLHSVHKHLGALYAGLALLHTIVHLIRWGVRNELQTQSVTQAGISGYFAIVFMIIVTLCMSPYAKKIKWIAFENRLYSHWLFVLLVAALCFHTQRTMIMSLIFGGFWALDYAYGLVFRTYRLDVVEFYPLPDMAGTQMLWRNPKGFSCKSGEYVKIRIPWITEGGDQWHPFSLYLREATEEGDTELSREGAITKQEVKQFLKEKRLSQREISLFTGTPKENLKIKPETTAVLLIEMQNEYVCSAGKLHNFVKDVMHKNKMLQNLSNFVDLARDSGLHIFHAPMIVCAEKQIDRDVYHYRTHSLFEENTWNAEFANQFKPKENDSIVKGKTGNNCFHGSNLVQLVNEKNIDTLIVAGFTTDGSVESTLFHADEIELDTIMLADATACQNMETQNSSACDLVSTVMSCEEASKIFEEETLQFSIPMVETMSSGRKSKAKIEKKISKKDFTVELAAFIDKFLAKPHEEERFIVKEARQDLTKLYNTSQIFISPEGSWTKGVNKAVRERRQLQTCWVRGPYTSPYFIATQFRHLILIASGIGITPALGVMGQYPGLSRTKVLIWMVRSKVMLKFFTPLLRDTHIALIFYTGKEKLTKEELNNLEGLGNIYVQQTRPDSLGNTIESVIVSFENTFDQKNPCIGNPDEKYEDNIRNQFHLKLGSIEKRHKNSWCVMYCGGSVTVKRLLKTFTEEHSLGFKSEFFNW